MIGYYTNYSRNTYNIITYFKNTNIVLLTRNVKYLQLNIIKILHEYYRPQLMQFEFDKEIYRPWNVGLLIEEK